MSDSFARNSPEKILKPPEGKNPLAEVVATGVAKPLTPDSVSKHDANNLEIKSDIALGTSHKGLRISLILPESLSTDPFSKTELWMDFVARNRVRAAENLSEDAQDLRDSIYLLVGKLQASSRNRLSRVKRLGHCAAEYFRMVGFREKARFSLIYGASSQSKPRLLLRGSRQQKELGNVAAKIRECCLELHKKDKELARYLSEYTHFNLVKTLANVTEDFHRYRVEVRDDDLTKDERKYLEKVVNTQRQEAEYFHQSPLFPGEEEGQAPEEVMMRLSSLKKFFQSTSFVDGTGEEYVKKFKEPVASLSAMFAAIAAATAGALISEASVVRLGAGSLGLVAIGIFFYVMRDRLKDRGKALFTAWLSGRFPEYRETLYFNDRKIGTVMKWLDVGKASSLHEPLASLKASLMPASSKESHVVVFREDFVPDKSERGTRIYHMVRLNLRRFLRFMDDAKKTIRLLNEEGEIEKKTVKKFYPFLIAVERLEDEGGEGTLVCVSRVLVTRKGIQKVEPLALSSQAMD